MDFESFRFICPCFDDEFIRRDNLEGFQAPRVSVGADEIAEMRFGLIMRLVVRRLTGASLIVRFIRSTWSRGFSPGEPMFDAVLPATRVKHMRQVCFAGGPSA